MNTVSTLTREQTLREMGLGPVWKLAIRAPAEGANTFPLSQGEGSRVRVGDDHRPLVGGCDEVLVSQDASSNDWSALQSAVLDCRLCTLCQQRKQAVLGVGDVQADWLFVGEGPGADEDEKGEPFVGQAGKLLDNMLAAIELKRGHDVYIANAVKCRPPGNRTPTDEELNSCRPYLKQQIAMIKPRLIVTLGGTAAKTLLQRDEIKVGSLRGQVHEYEGIPLIVTYHPSYLLRSPMEKAKAWEDLCFMRRTMFDLKQ